MKQLLSNIKFRFPLTRAGFSLFRKTIWQMVSFFFLLLLHLCAKGCQTASKCKFFPEKIKKLLAPRLSSFYTKAVKILDFERQETISRINLIELSLRNMKAKKIRTIITIGGMAVGIGAIVFLVSIGYGLQKLVIERVARLDEMRQIDTAPQAGGKVVINDKTLADFNNISQIDMALPLIAVVGRVNYKNSVSDMAVYGVTKDYLAQSAIKPIRGRIFESNTIAMKIDENNLDSEGDQMVKGITTEKPTGTYGEKIDSVNFSIDHGAWIRVRESPSTNAQILGYTKRTEEVKKGVQYWGGSYDSEDNVGKAGVDYDGDDLGLWINSEVLLWEKNDCNENESGDCEPGGYSVMRQENGVQVKREGYFAQIYMEVGQDEESIDESEQSEYVLGLETETLATDEADTDSDWVEIATEAGIIKPQDTKTVELSDNAIRQAVVNRAMLKVLGISETSAIGTTFDVSFVVVGDLLSKSDEKIESALATYSIVAVTPDEKTPLFYVPFTDLRLLGVDNYSQVKVVVNNQNDLSYVRKQIEAMGYTTHSVADTVAQINSLFSTARTMLALLGMIALFVAALGMFNTLTVSLLERTREVGLMKAMGMTSSEVQELFLTESMIMGVFGGLFGIILGYGAGKLAGVLLTFFALFRGVGVVDISYVPIPFILLIVFLSLLVGIATGIYPAKRATKISALNALRYE